jgi:hypothetical protein
MNKLYFILAANLLFGAPPRTIPSEEYLEFTMNGQIPVKSWYFDSTYSSDTPLVYRTVKTFDLLREVN